MTAEDVKVPASARLGDDGAGFGLMMSIVLPWFNVLSTSVSVGLMEAAVQRTAAHAGAGRFEHAASSIADLPTARAFIARMRIATDQNKALLADTLAADVHRTGPYQDHVRGRQAYVEFLARVVPALRNYSLDVARIRAIEGGGAVVELSESMDRGGVRRSYPDALLFAFDGDGRIARVEVFIQDLPR